MLLSTHIMQEVEAICDDVIIINQGKILVHDSKESISTANTHRQTIIVEFGTKPDEKVLQQIQGIQQIRSLSGNRWELVFKVKEDMREEIFRFAVKSQLVVLSMQSEEQSLEKIFRELTAANKGLQAK